MKSTPALSASFKALSKQKPSTLEQLECRKLFAIGGSYVAPVTPRLIINENAAWGHTATNTPNGVVVPSLLDLPYVRDATDANTGTDTFTKTIPTTAAMVGKKIFLHFEGAYLSTSVKVDGVTQNIAGGGGTVHNGGFSAFDFDVSTAMAAVGNHTVVVTVTSNNIDNTIPGQTGDYSHQGGIYRDVSLIVTNPTHVAVNEKISHQALANDGTNSGAARDGFISGPGVRFSNNDVVLGATGTTVQVATVLDNELLANKNVSIATYLVDAAGVIRAQGFTGNVALATGQKGFTLNQSMNISNPHLWDGRIDPYLYTLYVEVHDASSYRLLDMQTQKVGIRTVKINNPQNAAQALTNPPFVLNGHAYRVVGADMHQDTAQLNSRGNPAGWERSDAQTRSDIDLLAEMGGTAIRTSHYPDSQAFYDYCDKLGILVFTEVAIQTTSVSTLNAMDQYDEMVRANFNHPSIFAWGTGNEYDGSMALAKSLKSIAGGYGGTGLDPKRYVAMGTYAGRTPTYDANGNATNYYGVLDILGTHPYTYWYGNQSPPSANARQPQGVTEYGGGGSPFQYAESWALPKSAAANSPNQVTSRFHPQNQEVELSERAYTELANLGFLWGQFTWQFFDASSTGKNEGDSSHVNDKGLISRDRIPKDSFYFYKAALNDPTRNYANERVLKLSDQYWTARNVATTKVTVFSNIGAPTLVVNGVNVAMSQLQLPAIAGVGPALNPPNTYTANITLATGVNTINVTKTYTDGQKYTDSAVWTYRNGLDPASVQTAKIDFGASNSTPASGYTRDSGATYGTGGTTFGWLSAGGLVDAPGGTFGTGNLASNGINLSWNILNKHSSVWEYALANGTYDVQIGAGSSGSTDGVNNFTLEGKLAAIDTNGVGQQDTFYSRVTVNDGKLTLAAAPGAYNPRITFININAVTADTIKPLVAKISVNNNSVQPSSVNLLDNQRSSIKSLSVQFTEPVTLAAGAISLSLRGSPATSIAVTPVTTDDGSTYNLTLTGGAALSTLGDGVYDVIVDSTKVLDKNNNVMAALPGNIAGTFTRLFGDANGDRTVNNQDVVLFGLAKNTVSGQVSYKSYFDFDGDGDIDNLDNLRFGQHIGQTLVVT